MSIFGGYMNAMPQSWFMVRRHTFSRICETSSPRIGLLLILLFLFQLGWGQPATAQEQFYRFETLTRKDGLSQSMVTCILQDQNGFMWFGTQDGLNRFDGFEFKVFQHDPSDPTSISDNQVHTILEDRKGRLWIGTSYGGLNLFDHDSESFTRFTHDANDPKSLSYNNVRALQEDREGRLWVGTPGGGLNLYQEADNSFKHYQHNANVPTSLSHNAVLSMFEDSDGRLWVGTSGGGLNLFDAKTKSFTQFRHDPEKPNSLSNDDIRTIYEDRKGHLWIGTSFGLNRFDANKRQFVRYLQDPDDPFSLSENEIYAIHEDDEGILWIGTWGGGLNRFDRKSGRFYHLEHQPDEPNSLSDNYIWSLYEDRSGILWIGTWGGGVNKHLSGETPFVHYRHRGGEAFGLSHNSVNALFEDSLGYLWAGTSNGLNRLDRHTNTFKTYYKDEAGAGTISHNQVWSLEEDRSGLIWVGTFGGLNRFDRKTETFTHYYADPSNPNSLSNDFIRVVTEDRFGNLWIGTASGGLNRLDRATNRFERYVHNPADPTSISDNTVSTVFRSRLGDLWVGTSGGLNLLKKDHSGFERFARDANRLTSLSHDRVYHVYEDQAARLWVGTAEGLNQFQPESGDFLHYRKKDGLPDDTIYGILEDHLGRLWLSTNQGLSRFDVGAGRFENYGAQDGLQGAEFNEGAFFQSRSGEMMFGGLNGFNLFFPSRLKEDPVPPQVVITGMLLFNKPVDLGAGKILEKSIYRTQEMKLSHKDYVFAFEFAALHYADPEANQYAYKLEGLNEEWINTDADKRFATYTMLTPGNYVFRVKASNKDRVWNDEGAAIAITIAAPPWRSWWALSLYGIILFGLVYGYLTYQKRRLEKERELARKERQMAERLREVDRIKDEFLANTSHELRTPLNGIIGLAESLIDGVNGSLPEKTISNLEMIVASGRRLARLVNEILDFSRLQSKGIELERAHFNLRDVVASVISLAKSSVRDRQLIFLNEVPPNLEPVFADEDRVRQILHNLIGNAVKFTRSGTIRTTAEISDRMVRICVIDTGIGIPADKLDDIFESFVQGDGSEGRTYGGTGLGLAVTKQLVNLHGGSISVESIVGEGSNFTFTLPFFDPSEYPGLVTGSHESERDRQSIRPPA